MGELHTVGSVNPSLMSLTPGPLIYNTNPPTSSTLQTQQVYQASENTEGARVVNKIVSDWDSEEECTE